MNRHERRADAKQAKLQDDTAANAAAPPSAGSPAARPSLGLRVFARLLLSKWVMKRVHHPDLIAILMQIAQQVGRTDAIAQLTVKLSTLPR